MFSIRCMSKVITRAICVDLMRCRSIFSLWFSRLDTLGDGYPLSPKATRRGPTLRAANHAQTIVAVKLFANASVDRRTGPVPIGPVIH